MENNNRKKGPAVGWIILAFIIFWPVGMFLLYRRFTIDRTELLRGGKNLSVCAWILIAFACLSFVVLATSENGVENTAVMPFCIIIVLFGGLMLVKASKMKKQGARQLRYANLIVNQRISDVTEIAAAAGVPYSVAEQEIREMMYYNMIPNAYYDYANCKITMSGAAVGTFPTSASQNNQPAAGFQQQPAQNTVSQGIQNAPPRPAAAQAPVTRVVICGSCGATNTVTAGTTAECEFCGSPLQG